MGSLTIRAASIAAAAALVAMVIQAAVSTRFVPDWERARRAIPVTICCEPPTPLIPTGCCAAQFFETVKAPRKSSGRSLPSGRVVLRCSVDASDRLVNCAILSEEPAGKGLGDAAAQIAEGAHVPTLVGKRAAGGRMDVTVWFRT
jgi:hypothetical protein